MNQPGQDRPLTDAVSGLDAADERAAMENALHAHRQHLRELPATASPVDRARVELEIARTLQALGRNPEAWGVGRPTFDVFAGQELWAEAAETCDTLYLAEQPESIAALGNGIWLAVTYPVPPQLTVDLLHHVVEETPDHSDGGAVAAVAAHYIADLRAAGKERDDLRFLTGQVILKVARRQRGLEDAESIDMWIEIHELNDPKLLMSRLAKILDVVVGDKWWVDRDALRARLPVN